MRTRALSERRLNAIQLIAQVRVVGVGRQVTRLQRGFEAVVPQLDHVLLPLEQLLKLVSGCQILRRWRRLLVCRLEPCDELIDLGSERLFSSIDRRERRL